MTIRSLSAALLAFALAAGNATASTTVAGITLSDDGLTAIFDGGKVNPFVPLHHPKGTVTIYSNIGFKYPRGEYFCCFGDTVSGADSVLKAQNWIAAQFASPNDAKVTEIDLALESAAGTNAADISLYSDKGGLPDKLIKTFHLSGFEGVSSCCGLAIAKDKKGVAIKGGRPYWVAVTTSASDSFLVWADNSTDQINGLPIALNTGSGWQGAGFQVPQLTLGVFGK